MIIFRNKGLIDVRSITTFGVSSKEGKNPIGYFGTGLKYAIAILLREGCEITIKTGGEVLAFDSVHERIRVDDFDIVRMNGQPLGFTTELGKNWELWQAFRELYCNCTDEKGTIEESDNDECGPDETVVIIDGEKVKDVWGMRSQIILDTEPFIKTEWVNIHHGANHYIFYRGVRVGTLPYHALFTYDIQSNLTLTEDRTVRSSWDVDSYVRRAVMALSCKETIKAILVAHDGTFEHEITFSGSPSNEFLDVCKSLAKSFDLRINPSARRLCKDWLSEALHVDNPYKLNVIEEKQLARAVKFCKEIGFDVDDYEIVVSAFLGESILGRAVDETIYLSQRVFMQGTKQVAVTLIEEYLHIKEKLQDETYSMQNYLFNIIGSLGERLTGDAL